MTKIETILEIKMNHHYTVSVFEDYTLHPDLKNCAIFIAESLADSELNNPKDFVGVYKTDSIIWYSEPLTENLSSLGGVLSSISDYNNDGKVEIVISEYELPGSVNTYYLWIISWDGKQGKIINQIDEHGETSICFTSDFEFIDLDNDGISEIRGEWYADDNIDSTTEIIYSWDGSRYGKWKNNSKYFLNNRK